MLHIKEIRNKVIELISNFDIEVEPTMIDVTNIRRTVALLIAVLFLMTPICLLW